MRIDLDRKIIETPLMDHAIQILDDVLLVGIARNIENPTALIVGGCVRDLILGRNINDIDIATNVPVDLIEDCFPTHDIGRNKEFGLIVMERGDENFEIANFRTESSYTNGRHPDKVEFIHDFQSDAARRDFNINALAMDRTGNIIDHFDGLQDLKDGIIRTVGDPSRRFTEDFLRMLRAVRFSTRFSFTIEHETFEAIRKNAHNIVNVSPERITQELMKMASETGEKFARSIELMKETGLLAHILPEIDVMDQHEHSPEHHPEGFFVRKL